MYLRNCLLGFYAPIENLGNHTNLALRARLLLFSRVSIAT